MDEYNVKHTYIPTTYDGKALVDGRWVQCKQDADGYWYIPNGYPDHIGGIDTGLFVLVGLLIVFVAMIAGLVKLYKFGKKAYGWGEKHEVENGPADND